VEKSFSEIDSREDLDGFTVKQVIIKENNPQMTTKPRIFKQSNTLVLLLIFLPMAVGMGVMAAFDNRIFFLALGLLGALFYAVLSFSKPFIALAILVIIAWTEVASGIQIVSNISLMIALAVLFVFVWVVRLAAHKVTFVAVKEYFPLFGLGSVIAISSIVNWGGPAGFWSILTYLQQFLLVILIVNFVTTSEKYRAMGMVIIMSASLIAVPMVLAKFGWVSAYSLGIGISNNDPMNPRMMGFFGDPNFTSAQLLVALPFIVEFLPGIDSKRQRILLLAVGGMILLAFAFTLSIGGLVGLLVYIILQAIFLSPRNVVVKLGKGLLGVTIFILIVFTWFPMAIRSKIQENVDILADSTSTDSSNSFANFGTGRGAAWQASLWAIEASPLVGYGPGNGIFAIGRYGYAAIFRDRNTLASHNMYLSVAADLGILGLLFFLSLYSAAFILVKPRRTQQKHLPPLLQATNKAVFAAITICLVLGLGLNLNLLKFPWVLIGMALVSGHLAPSMPTAYPRK
jgi:putative inorganic carbon (HCO3(-)) transporter